LILLLHLYENSYYLFENSLLPDAERLGIKCRNINQKSHLQNKIKEQFTPYSRLKHKIHFTLKRVRCFSLFALFLFGQLAAQTHAQPKANILPYNTIDTAVVNHTLNMGRESLKKGKLDEAQVFAKQGRQQAKQINYPVGMARGFNMEANILCRKGNYPEAVAHIDSALAIEQRVADSTLQATSFMIAGNIQCYMGKYAKGMECYFNGLAIEEKLKVQHYVHWFYSNIGNLYLDQKNYQKALEYSLKAIKAEEKAQDKEALLNTSANLGQIYSSLGKNDSALHYYNLALKTSHETNDGFGIANSLVNMAILYTKLKQYDKATDFSLRGSKLCVANGFIDLYVYSLSNLGTINRELKKYDVAENYYMEAVNIAKKINSKILIRESYLSLAALYEEQRDFKKSYDYYKLYSETKDSLLNQENSKLITEMNTKYTTEKKEKEIELLKKNEDIQNLELTKKKNELENQQTISLSVFSGFILLMIVAVLLFNRYQLKKKANNQLQAAFNLIEEKNVLIEKSNLMITDSITYAKRIQDAVLPDPEDLSKLLSEEFFIFYKPAQIVSGDFYWCASQNGKTIFVVADCTGHGVPGAFMSMIGNTLLNEIVNEQKITCTKKIAELLDKKIIHALHQHSGTDQYDGMDISICCIDKPNKEISFTGAHHTMYVYNGQLQKIKGDPYSIGGAQHQDFKIFSAHKIAYKENQKLYFLTDGYCDQAGGGINKRFNSNKFEKILSEIQELKMVEQKETLEFAFEDWKGSTKQRDDILVAGIKC
jgi:serine phosphatase RsbU (regulator of sigma subunit)